MEIRERILEGAAELFKAYGIKAVTMDSLASHLGMSKRTIYEVISDKDELLKGVIRLMAEKQRDLVERVLQDSDNSIIAIFKLIEINRNHFQDMSPAFQEDMKRFHQQILLKQQNECEMPDYSNNLQVIERGINEKLFREDINPDLVNRCLYSLGRSVMNDELYPFEKFSRREVLKNIFFNYLKGISTPEGIKLINQLEEKF